jgi:hypothetical protein
MQKRTEILLLEPFNIKKIKEKIVILEPLNPFWIPNFFGDDPKKIGIIHIEVLHNLNGLFKKVSEVKDEQSGSKNPGECHHPDV